MSYIQISVFFVLALAVLFGSHYFLYFSSIKFFSFDLFWRRILFGTVAFFSISFILSAVLSQMSDVFPVRAYYILSNLWIGFAWNLLMAFTFAWAIIGISRFFDLDPNKMILGLSFSVAALVFSFYGIHNALNPELKNISVKIPGLPSEWQGKKIVYFSDTHFGDLHRGTLMSKVTEKINAVSPEMVFMAGDLFDTVHTDFSFLSEYLKTTRAEKGIYFVTGNHETYLGTEKIFDILGKANVNILQNEVVDVSGLKIIGISYPERNEKNNTAAIIKDLQDQFYGQPNILLYHSPSYIREFKEAGVNLQLSGHTHKGQIFPFGYITRYIYNGFDYGLYSEVGYSIYTTSGAGTWGPLMRTGSRSEIVIITLQ